MCSKFVPHFVFCFYVFCFHVCVCVCFFLKADPLGSHDLEVVGVGVKRRQHVATLASVQGIGS